jgi:hypothetical protein
MNDRPTAIPVIKQALGSAWDELAPVIRRHYDISPGSDERVLMTGTMTRIDHSLIAKLFLLPGRVFGALIPYRGSDIPATVENRTRADDPRGMSWHRRFEFPGHPGTVFRSYMVHAGGDEIIEYVRFGLGIRMKMSVEQGSLIYSSTGYQWDIGRWSLRFPTWLILGAGRIRETGLSDSAFEMDFEMRHPLFGKTFSYAGRFELS